MGDIIAEGINYDDESDPLIKKLRFLEHSPSTFVADTYQAGIRFGWSRERIEQHISELERPRPPEFENDPSSWGFLHSLWMDSIESYDPVSQTFDPDELKAKVELVLKEQERMMVALGAPGGLTPSEYREWAREVRRERERMRELTDPAYAAQRRRELFEMHTRLRAWIESVEEEKRAEENTPPDNITAFETDKGDSG